MQRHYEWTTGRLQQRQQPGRSTTGKMGVNDVGLQPPNPTVEQGSESCPAVEFGSKIGNF